jgi:hypothetical protein
MCLLCPAVNPGFLRNHPRGVVNSRMSQIQKLFDMNTGGGIISWTPITSVIAEGRAVATQGSHVIHGLIQGGLKNVINVNSVTQFVAGKLRTVITLPSSVSIGGLPVSLSLHPPDVGGYIRAGISKIFVGR